MATNLNEGGPAFPRTGGEVQGPNSPEWVAPQSGMTLRDWFAGQAMAGWLASWPNGSPGMDRDSAERVANTSYKLADAMLAARAPATER